MDAVKDSISDIQKAVAVLQIKIEHINGQLESRNRWIQGIGVVFMAALLLGLCKVVFDSNSGAKASPVGISTSKAK